MKKRSAAPSHCALVAGYPTLSTGVFPINKLLLGPLLFAPLLACAATPSFDCAKAAGAVETLICKDAALAALDNELATLYPKALSNLSPEQLKTEKAMQRGWIKGRNDCWKAKDLRQCVEENYQQRITELQIKGGQLTVLTPVDYQCGNNLTLFTKGSDAMLERYGQPTLNCNEIPGN